MYVQTVTLINVPQNYFKETKNWSYFNGFIVLKLF